jgi:hypothetical protein
MIAPDVSKHTAERANGDSNRTADLPFLVELWDEERNQVDRVLARTHGATLAEAVFRAACEQYPGRHLTLWRDSERLAERG